MAARMKVGELARRTGLSIRSLHFYEEIGLLAPVDRTDSGHRLYGARDVARLQQITSLRQLGFSLDQIRQCLDHRTHSIRDVIEMHIARLRRNIEADRELCQRLETIAEHMRASGKIPVARLLEAIEVMTMMDKYFTPEQRELLKQRKESVGEERIEQVEAEWPKLIAAVRTEMDKGTDPAAEPVKQLARRWMELVREFSGGDQTMEKSVATMYANEPSAAERFGLDPEIFEYVGKAIAALEK